MTLCQEGPRTARIALVGEAPGAEEERIKRPFVGGAGEQLNTMLGRAGIDRALCFVTNIAHVRPPGNEFEWFERAANWGLLASGLKRLKEDLEAIRPNVIVALGKYPLWYLTGKTPIGKWRGSILEGTLVPGTKVIGTYHPASVLRVWEQHAVVEMDLRKAVREAAWPEIRRPSREFILDPDPATRTRVAREMAEAPWLSVDIETLDVHGDGRWGIACVGFADGPHRALVIPYHGPDAIETVRMLCGSPAKKVLQNGTFDTMVLADNGITLTNFAWDTMLAHHALYPECASGEDEMAKLKGSSGKKQAVIGKGLDFLCSIYTDEPYYKDSGKVWRETGDILMFYRYNALDAMVTYEVMEAQRQELEDMGLGSTFERRMALVQPLIRSTRRGIPVDLRARDKLRGEILGEITAFQSTLDSAAGEPINVKSTAKGGDMQRLLYTKLRLPPQRNKESGALSTDREALVALVRKTNHPVLRTILAIRERRDILERYLDTPIDADGRMRCSFDITGTRTARLASRASIYGSGTNLQNQPPRIRDIYVPDPGKVFVYADFSQAEARVVARLARSSTLSELFADRGRDVHRENAARLFDVAVHRVTEEQRYLAKRIVHAMNYGMESERFAEIVNEDALDSWGKPGTGVTITQHQARILRERYFMLYPEIQEVFWRGVETQLRQTRTLTTPWGMSRMFFGRWSDKMVKEAIAYKPQSTIGELCNMAWVRADEMGLDVLLGVHDSLLVQCPVKDALTVADRLQEAMAIPIPFDDGNLLIPTDCEIGFNWGKATPRNPAGLRKHSEWLKQRAG